MTLERRNLERTAVYEPIVVGLGDRSLRLTLAGDLSLGGMFIDGLSEPVGTRVVVHMRIDGGDSLRAIVRWSESDKMGVEFEELDATGAATIANALARATFCRERARRRGNGSAHSPWFRGRLDGAP